jgi:N-acylneuraminate cytidylyltransferase
MFNGKKVIAIIPARSGSKSIKNKNIIKIKGKPMIEYTIEYAKKSKLVDQIIVSTDSQKYLNKIRKYNLTYEILRKKQLSKDLTQDFPVVKDALIKSELFFNEKFDYIILLRPTSPFREKNLIENSLKLLTSKKKASSVRAMQKVKQHPYRQWKFMNNKIFVKSILLKVKEPFNLPRQRLPQFFFQTGEIETIRRSTILKGSISGKYVLPLIIKKQSVDVDYLIDLQSLNKNV